MTQEINIIKQDEKSLLVKPNTYLKDKSQFPPHLTIHDYRKLRECIINYYIKRNKITDNYRFMTHRDLLLVDFMWETGGRVGDVINVKLNNFENNTLNLYTQKRKKTVRIYISSELYADILNFVHKFNIKDDEKIFNLSIQRIWQILRKYAKEIDFPHMIKVYKNGRKVITTLRPHLFRHGIAIHLMNLKVNPAIVSARLGHADVAFTMKVYQKVTVDIQKNHMDEIGSVR